MPPAGAGESESDPVVPHIPERPGVVVSVIVVLKVALGIYLGLMALFMLWLRPSFDTMFWSILIGVTGGLGYSWLFYSARYMKSLLNNGVSPSAGPCILAPLRASINNSSLSRRCTGPELLTWVFCACSSTSSQAGRG